MRVPFSVTKNKACERRAMLEQTHQCHIGVAVLGTHAPAQRHNNATCTVLLQVKAAALHGEQGAP